MKNPEENSSGFFHNLVYSEILEFHSYTKTN